MDHVYTLDTIIEEALNDKRNELEEQIVTNVTYIYNTYLTNLKNSLKAQIQKYFVNILEVYDHQYNASITYFNSMVGSNGTITEISVAEQIQNVFKDFISEVKKVYTNSSLSDEIAIAQNKKIDEGINILTVYSDENSKLLENLNTFIEEANKRYVDEQLEFKANIESAFVKGYNKTIIDFLNGEGINLLNSIYEQDYESTINHTFNYLTEEVENIKDYMLVLMESSDLKLLAKRLTSALKVIYSDVNDEFKQVIPIQVTNIVYKKILSFENEVLNKIPEIFISKLKTQLASSDFKVNMQNNQRVLGLIPKSFSQGFNANLTTYLKDMLDIQSLDNIRSLYKTKVDTDLDVLSTLMIEINDLIGDTASKKSQGQTTEDSLSAIDVYEEYADVVSAYNSEFIIEESEDKKNNIGQFFTDYLLKDIQSIRTGFEEQIEIGEIQVEEAMSNYRKVNVYANVKTELESKKISNIVSSVNDKINQTMNLLPKTILEIFEKGLKELDNKCKDLSVEGLKLKKRNRNLKEYNLNNVFAYIKYAYNNYLEFNKTIFTNPKFVGIRTKEGSFYNKLSNSLLHLDDYFFTYEYLIQEYTSLGTFTESYRVQSVNINNYIRNYLQVQSTKIDNTVNLIKLNVRNSWNSIKQNIDSSIKNALDTQFERLLKDITSLPDYNQSIDNIVLNQLIEPINVYDNKQQLLFTINLETIANDMRYGYSIKPDKVDNMYNFDVKLYTTGGLGVRISTEIGDFYKGEFKGTLGSGEIGIHPYYYLSDKSVEVEAYYLSSESNYLSLWQEFNFDSLTFDIDIEANITVQEKAPIKFNKIYRHIAKEL